MTGEKAQLPVRVLFVCTGNIARSPYAERRAATLLPSLGFSVASAGIPGTLARGMDSEMQRQLSRHAVAATDHRSRHLTGELLGDSDLVLTMEFRHHLAILERWPGMAYRVAGLRQFVLGMSALAEQRPRSEDFLGSVLATMPANSMAWDVDDPYGRGRRAARRCADELDGLLDGLVAGLTRSAPASIADTADTLGGLTRPRDATRPGRHRAR